MALTNLLSELRSRGGFSVIFGDAGTGKTTLLRKLFHELNKREDMIFYMILDPFLFMGKAMAFSGQNKVV